MKLRFGGAFLLDYLYFGVVVSVIETCRDYQKQIEISCDVHREIIFEIRRRCKYEDYEPVGQYTAC